MLGKRFAPGATADLERSIRQTNDMEQLDRWLDAALDAATLTAFRQKAGLAAQNGGRRQTAKANVRQAGAKTRRPAERKELRWRLSPGTFLSPAPFEPDICAIFFRKSLRNNRNGKLSLGVSLAFPDYGLRTFVGMTGMKEGFLAVQNRRIGALIVVLAVEFS